MAVRLTYYPPTHALREHIIQLVFDESDFFAIPTQLTRPFSISISDHLLYLSEIVRQLEDMEETKMLDQLMAPIDPDRDFLPDDNLDPPPLDEEEQQEQIEEEEPEPEPEQEPYEDPISEEQEILDELEEMDQTEEDEDETNDEESEID